MNQILKSKKCLTKPQCDLVVKYGGSKFWMIRKYYPQEMDEPIYKPTTTPTTQKLNIEVDLPDGDYVITAGHIREYFSVTNGSIVKEVWG